MHQIMKTFSDITAIDTRRQLKVHLVLKRHGRTESLVRINGFVINVDDITFELDLLDSVKLDISLLDFDEGHSGIEVANFSINGIEVLPKYRHLATKPTNYIDFYDEWSLAIPQNFYNWYHHVSGKGWIA